MTEAIQPREEFWRNPANGHTLFARIWEPVPARAWLILVHGFGEHSGRYGRLAQAIASHGLAVACADLWGHGRSEGQRGDIERFEEYLHDLETLVRHCLAAREPSSYAVFGHSFGGLLAARWAERRPAGLQAVILQSPLFEVGFPLPRWKELLVNQGARWWPRLSLSLGVNPAWLSHDPQIVQGYQHDSLVHNRMTLRGAAALRAAMRQTLDDAQQIRLPTLLLYGTEDHVVSVDAGRRFYERLACDKRVVGFPASYHELHHEAVQPTVVEEMVRWIESHA
ncbi:MAG: lysophospholipase [Candidatus Omnitrophica bacterium]|nr:lysophospholipase [Candidatus Omnitrophota bacterium]